MKQFRFLICGDIFVDDDVDETDLRDALQDAMEMPMCGHSMSVDSVELEDWSDDEEDDE